MAYLQMIYIIKSVFPSSIYNGKLSCATSLIVQDEVINKKHV